MNIKTQRMLSLGLSLVNTAGVVGTFMFATKEAPTAQKALESLPKNTKKTTRLKTFIKGYKKSLIMATATIASGLGSRFISAKTEASLMATAAMLDTSLRKYKNKIKQTLGIEADKNIVKEIMKDEYKTPAEGPCKGEQLFYEEHIGYFYAFPEKVKDAYITMNEDIAGVNVYYRSGYDFNGSYTIGEFLKLCQGRPLSHNLDDSKLNFGWDWDYLAEQWEMTWIHMDVSEPDEHGARMIYWFEPPVWNPSGWYGYVHSDTTKEEYFEGCPKTVDKNACYYIKEGE